MHGKCGGEAKNINQCTSCVSEDNLVNISVTLNQDTQVLSILQIQSHSNLGAKIISHSDPSLAVKPACIAIVKSTSDNFNLQNPSLSNSQMYGVQHLVAHISFQFECVLLVEYIEIIVAILYGSRLLVAYQMPNKQYCVGLRDMREGDELRASISILVYEFIQFLNW